MASEDIPVSLFRCIFQANRRPLRLKMLSRQDSKLVRALDLATFKKLDGMPRHDRRNCVLVDQLGMTIAAQKHAKIVKPGHDALQFNAIHQENCERDLVLADIIEKGVL